MIVGIGTDIAEVRRIRRSIEQFGERFLARLFTPFEMAYARSSANSVERYAARFAAKEAGMKAIGTGWNCGVGWHDFEVRNEPSGQPQLVLSGAAKDIADRLAVVRTWLSMTHTAELAYAVVVLEGSSPP